MHSVISTMPLFFPRLLAALSFFAGVDAAQDPAPARDPLAERAREIAALFVEKPEPREGLFHRSFLDQVPAHQVIGIFKSYHRQGGRCVAHELVSCESSWAGSFVLRFEKSRETTLTLSIEPSAPHAVVGLFVTNLEPALSGFPELAAELEKLPGRAGACVMRLGEGEPELVFAREADASFAIGSSFKLYVLGALVQAVNAGERRWSDVVELDARWRSLPTGALTDWPVGAPFTLYSLAGLMISQSDNTATDHLLFTLGRERVDALVEPMGNACAAANRPLLSTAELFRLKGSEGGKYAAAYVALDVDARRAYLDETVARLPLDAVSVGAIARPLHIGEIEWFASCADLCRAMDWIRKQSAAGEAQAVRELLAINRGLPTAARFAYAGYKGGSEGGVLNQTWLLQRADGAWLAFSASWNDADEPLEEARFFGLAGRALGLVSTAALR